MHLVFLSQTFILPLLHGFQSSHNVELIPNGGIVFLPHLVDRNLNEQAVGVHLIFVLLQFLKAVVITHEKQGTIGIDALDDFNQLGVIAFETFLGEILFRCIVDANAEYNQVGLDQFQVALEIITTQIGRHACAVHAHAMHIDARHTVFKQNARNGELARNGIETDADGNQDSWQENPGRTV